MLDKLWLRVIILAIVVMVVIIGWEIFMVLSGTRETVEYNIVPIGADLYGNVGDHLKADPEFQEFEEQVQNK